MQIKVDGLVLKPMGTYIIVSAQDEFERIWIPAGGGIDMYIGHSRWKDSDGLGNPIVVKFFDDLFSNAHNFNNLSEVDDWANEYDNLSMQDAWNNFFSDWFEWFEDDVTCADDEETCLDYQVVLKYMRIYLGQHALVSGDY